MPRKASMSATLSQILSHQGWVEKRLGVDVEGWTCNAEGVCVSSVKE